MQIGGIGSVFTTSYQPLYGGIGYENTGFPAVDATGNILEEDKTSGVRPGYKSSPAECQTCNVNILMALMKMYPSSLRHIFRQKRQEAQCGRMKENTSAMLIQRRRKIMVRSSMPVCRFIHRSARNVEGRMYQVAQQIRYNESNPYGKNQKSADAANLIGGKLDYRV